jgi:Ca2+/H+ antiporter, TMEM165/GDT1 family
MSWSHIVTAGLPAFLASLVEFVEALTIVLAVGVTRGWRSALLGTLGGIVLLAALVLGFGPALAMVPLAVLRLVIGVLLLLFGLRWLRKAILRSAGVIALHDEERIFDKQRTALGSATSSRRIDVLGFVTSFKAVVLEGLEVVFIVIAVGATAGALVPATVGAAAAGAIVIGTGAIVHQPLSRVPENTLKFVVGILLSSFGTFWTGEAFGVVWPGADLSVIFLVMGYVCVAAIGIGISRTAPPRNEVPQ